MSHIANADQLIEFFEGYSYDFLKNKVVEPGGGLLNRGQFNVIMGGHTFVTSFDGSTFTRSAWNAFIHNPLIRPPFA